MPANPPYILALDQGTTSSRSILFDSRGTGVAVSQKEFRQIYPQPGWVEHDASEIWTTQLQTAQNVLAKAGLTAADIAAIGITNQRETAVVWDRSTGDPVHNAIVWQDRRTASQTDALKGADVEAAIRWKTGLLPDPYFSASKLSWLLDNVPGLRARAQRGELAFGTVDSWLVFKLSGGRTHVTDVSNASRTMLYNIRTGEWDDELLDLFAVPRSVLPRVVPSSGRLGDAAADVLGAAAPIGGIAGDQQAALFGQLCLEPGMLKNTYGTGCFLLVNTGTTPVASTSNLLTTVAWRLEGEPTVYALEGSVFIGGAAVQWLRDGLGIIGSAPQVNELAAQVADTGGVVVVPAFVGLGAPHWDPSARGLIIGITRGTTAAHIARATLQSIAFQVGDVVCAMARDMEAETGVLRADGGAAASDLLLQMQADVLGSTVERPAVLETTALGAAYLAGLSAGIWDTPEALQSQRRVDRVFTPASTAAERSTVQARWADAVTRTHGWA